MHRATSAYFQTQVNTTSQGELVILLYDGLLGFLAQARSGLEAGNMAAKGVAISKALDVLNELDSSLNMERGGSLAANLHGLYLFCINHLVKANIQKSCEMIDEVVKIVSGLRSAYAEIADLPEAREAAREAGEMVLKRGGGRQIRTQTEAPPCQTPAMPGAGARARSLYAKNAGLAQDAAPEASPEAACPREIAPATEPAAPQAAAPAPQAAVPQTAAPQAVAPLGADEKEPTVGAAQGFPRPPAFGRSMAGAYSKVAGQ